MDAVQLPSEPALSAATPSTAEAAGYARDEQDDALRTAYIAGATDVHNNWQEDRDPDFSEAASDYVASLATPDRESAK